MAHNPYHIDQVYDYNSAGSPQAKDTLSDIGYDFGGSEYEKYFDKYDPVGENFATQGNALNQAFQNQQFGSATSNFQDQLSNLSRNTPFSGFSKSGGLERGLDQARSNIMRGYGDMRNQHLYNQAQGDLALQQDIFGMRKDYKDDTRKTLIDLLKSGADLSDFKIGGDDEQYDDRTRGRGAGDGTNLDVRRGGDVNPNQGGNVNEGFDINSIWTYP